MKTEIKNCFNIESAFGNRFKIMILDPNIFILIITMHLGLGFCH